MSHAFGVGHGVVDVSVRREPIATTRATGHVAGADELVECSAGSVPRLRLRLGCYHGPEFGSAGEEFGEQWRGHDAAAENECRLLSSLRLLALCGVGSLPMKLGIASGLCRLLFGDDVDDDAAGTAVVVGCGAIRAPASA